MKRLSILASFTMLGINLYSQDINLTQGWSLKAALEDINSSQLFTKNCIETVWSYNSTNNRWEAYSPHTDIKEIISNSNGIDDLISLKQGEGYWINVTSDDCTLDVKEEEKKELALENPKFDKNDATFDTNACTNNGYNNRNHIAGLSPNKETKDISNGISIKSNLSANSSNIKYFRVDIYYKSNSSEELSNETTSFSKSGVFELNYDRSWVFAKYNTVYLKYYNSSSDNLPTCQRVSLNNKNGDKLESEKVFR